MNAFIRTRHRTIVRPSGPVKANARIRIVWDEQAEALRIEMMKRSQPVAYTMDERGRGRFSFASN